MPEPLSKGYPDFYGGDGVCVCGHLSRGGRITEEQADYLREKYLW